MKAGIVIILSAIVVSALRPTDLQTSNVASSSKAAVQVRPSCGQVLEDEIEAFHASEVSSAIDPRLSAAIDRRAILEKAGVRIEELMLCAVVTKNVNSLFAIPSEHLGGVNFSSATDSEVFEEKFGELWMSPAFQELWTLVWRNNIFGNEEEYQNKVVKCFAETDLEKGKECFTKVKKVDISHFKALFAGLLGVDLTGVEDKAIEEFELLTLSHINEALNAFRGAHCTKQISDMCCTKTFKDVRLKDKTGEPMNPVEKYGVEKACAAVSAEPPSAGELTPALEAPASTPVTVHVNIHVQPK